MENVRRKREPMRTCAACRSVSAKKGFVRIVRAADGQVRIDLSGRVPGRGAYLCKSADCVARALRRKSLDRVLRIAVPAGIYEELGRIAEI